MDPFRGDNVDPQSLNKYAYVHVDPVNHVDPNGLQIQIRTPAANPAFPVIVQNAFQRIIGTTLVLSLVAVAPGITRLAAAPGQIPEGFKFRHTRRAGTDLQDAINSAVVYTVVRIAATNNAFFNPANNQIGINENINVNLDEVAVRWPFLRRILPYTSRQARFDVVLWHEAIGHGHLGQGHPQVWWNKSSIWSRILGIGRSDPTIKIENNARRSLNSQGFQVQDRIPGYF